MLGTVNISTKLFFHRLIAVVGLSSLLFLCACQSSSRLDCDYYPQEFVRMKIVKIESVNTSPDEYDVWLEFDQSLLGKELQNLRTLREDKITQEYLKLNKLKEGAVISGYVSELKDGNCEPYILSFNQQFKLP